MYNLKEKAMMFVQLHLSLILHQVLKKQFKFDKTLAIYILPTHHITPTINDCLNCLIGSMKFYQLSWYLKYLVL